MNVHKMCLLSKDKMTEQHNNYDLQLRMWEEGEALGVVGEAELASLHFTLSVLNPGLWRRGGGGGMKQKNILNTIQHV